MLSIEPRHYSPPATDGSQAAEWALCEASPIYFIAAYCWVFNATDEAWIPFDLWPAQGWALDQIARQPLVVILKARQLGFTWLILGYCLWLVLFRPAATIGIFSRTETDAGDLLDFRLKGMYEHLPAFMRARAVLSNNMSRWELSNGSVAMAFATTGGRGYTFSFVLVDEADFQENLAQLMRAIKPTIDAGGAMALLSTSDKSAPRSPFKQIYRAAKRGQNSWHALFLPWHARPGRSAAWYADQCRDAMANAGSLDDVQQEYPASDAEALAPRTLDKRIPAAWLLACFEERAPDGSQAGPAVPGLEIYAAPEPGRLYVVGVDPAEGNPTSDDSALTVLDVMAGQEAAALSGKFQPATIAELANAVGTYYNRAGLMVERNNHGHAVLLWLEEHSTLQRLEGHDNRAGWLSSRLGKTLLYNELADAFRNGDTLMHSFATYEQIANIEGSTLRAPAGEHDDRADSYTLAQVGRAKMLEDKSNFRQVPQSVNLFGARSRHSNQQQKRGRRHGR